MNLRASTYDYDTNAAGDESALKCEDQSLAQQHMKDECDINVLVKRFVVTGEIPELELPPMQGDFNNAPTYQEALNLMVEANRSFMQQPADIRARFENDPAKFVDFVSNPDNYDSLRPMGMWNEAAVARFDEQERQKAALNAANQRAADELAALKKPTHGAPGVS